MQQNTPPTPRGKGRGGAAWRKASAQCRATATHCWLCLDPLDPQARYPSARMTTVHHVIPLGVGGAPLDPRNLAATHKRCNEVVGDRIVPRGHLAKKSAVKSATDNDNRSRRW